MQENLGNALNPSAVARLSHFLAGSAPFFSKVPAVMRERSQASKFQSVAAAAKGAYRHTTLGAAEVAEPWSAHIWIPGSWLQTGSAFVPVEGWAGLRPQVRSLHLSPLQLPGA